MAEIFKTIIEPLQSSAAVKSLFGDPVSAQGKTVIPVARIAWGFGGGWGKREREGKPAEDGKAAVGAWWRRRWEYSRSRTVRRGLFRSMKIENSWQAVLPAWL